MARMVQCVKTGRLLPGLDQPPFPGELGDRIFDHISAEAYAMWQPFATMLINHNGLSLGNPQHRDFLVEQMEEFFFGADAAMPEGWIPESEQSGKGGAPAPMGKGGAPRGKGGAPAPQRK